jgi:hypothetical protein
MLYHGLAAKGMERMCFSGPSSSTKDVIESIITLIHLCSIDVDTALLCAEGIRLHKIASDSSDDVGHDIGEASGLSVTAVFALMQVAQRIEGKTDVELDALRQKIESSMLTKKALVSNMRRKG